MSIVELYDQVMSYTPTPVVALNRAVALAEVHGAQAALDAVDRLDLARERHRACDQFVAGRWPGSWATQNSLPSGSASTYHRCPNSSRGFGVTERAPSACNRAT